MSGEPLVVEAAGEEDFAAITAIYAHHVLHGTATFETEPPTLAEMKRRWSDWTAQGFPWLVARRGGRILGYAYAAPYRTRPAYRFTVEDSVYVDAGATGLGAGGALLQALIDACRRGGFRQMIAVIGDSANAASIGLHRARGFELIGVQRAVGFKFERWLDCVMMQRALDDAPPSARATKGRRARGTEARPGSSAPSRPR